MFALVIYFVGVLISLILAIYAWSIIIFGFFGPPAVPTPKRIILETLDFISPKKDDFLLDLGSGTGRVLRLAAKKYGVRGVGVDINPFLIWWSRITSWLEGTAGVQFKKESFYNTDLSKANIIFLYLLPKYLPKMMKKLRDECKKGTLVISQRFYLEGWEKYLAKETERKHNSTYIYRII